MLKAKGRISRAGGRLLLGISVFWLGLSMLFDGINALVLPSQLVKLTDEATRATTLGLITFAGLVAGMLVQPVAGLLSDRLRRRWGRRGFLGLGLLLTLAALALLGAGNTLTAVVAGYVLIQLSASSAQAAQQGFLPDLVPAQWRGTAAGMKGFMDFGGALLGFVVLGQLLGGGEIRRALLAIAAVLVVTYLLTVVLVREPVPGRTPGEGALRRQLVFRDAFRLDWHRHRRFARVVVSRFLFLLGTYAVGRFLLYFVADRLGLDPARAADEAGALLGALTLLTLLGSIPAGWASDRFGRIPLMLGGAVLSAAGVLLLATAATSWQIFLFGGLMAIGSAAFASANWALTADLVPADEAGRFFGLANVGTAGAAAVAGLFGPLMDWANRIAPGTGYTALFVTSGLVFIASTLPLWPITVREPEPAVSRLEAG